MRYAHVVLGLPLDRAFDYAIPDGMQDRAAPGCRVAVNFRGKKSVGYIVAVSDQSSFSSLKPLLSLIDQSPLLSPLLREFTEKLSRYYCCSWGEMIETALPDRLRKGAGAEAPFMAAVSAAPRGERRITVLRAAGFAPRWESYCRSMEAVLAQGKKVIVLVPDIGAIPYSRAMVTEKIPSASVGVLFRKQPRECSEWLKASKGEYSVVIGTRSAVFAPLSGVGLIIVDEEQDHGYKQDQVPHYHARTAAIERGRIEGASVVLGSAAPSLEALMLCEAGDARLEEMTPSRPPEVKTIDTTRLPFGVRSRAYVSRYAQDAISAEVAQGGKVLVFIDRRGFATSAACSRCGIILKCPRCSTNLVYYFKGQELACNYCRFRMAPPTLCPECNSGYIKFEGAGAEKVESELARIFPSARIEIVSPGKSPDPSSADIFVATQSILSRPGCSFGLTTVLSLDNSLNHADFRATEKTYSLLTGLAAITTRRLLIQTTVPRHYVVKALESGDAGSFYEKELALRRQLCFPPVCHFALVKCRGVSEGKCRAAAEDIARIFTDAGSKDLLAISVSAGQPARLRGQYHWNVLLSGSDPACMSGAIKNCLTDFKRSGIIVTVDMDPL